jgi:hypothetical protein
MQDAVVVYIHHNTSEQDLKIPLANFACIFKYGTTHWEWLNKYKITTNEISF